MVLHSFTLGSCHLVPALVLAVRLIQIPHVYMRWVSMESLITSVRIVNYIDVIFYATRLISISSENMGSFISAQVYAHLWERGR